MYEIQDFFQNMSYMGNLLFWTALTLFFTIVEAGTSALVSIWFVFGALAAFAAALSGAALLPQFVIFVAVSALLFVTFRPLLLRWFRPKETSTNVDSIVGMKGVVLVSIRNIQGEGRVKVNGLDWAARSANGKEIEVGRIIAVKSVEGVTLTVEEEAKGAEEVGTSES